MWQSCTEFASFPTTDAVGGDTIFGSLVSLSFYADICRDVFGENYDIQYIEKAVQSTIERYGGADGYKGTNVVIPNGALDPWSLLSKSTTKDPSVVPYRVKGGTHCEDMFPPLRGPVREELQVLYKLISQNIDNWISNIPSPFHIPHTENKMPEKPWTRPEIMHPIERLKNPFKPARRQDALRTFITPKSRKRNARYKIHLGRPQSGLLPEPEMVN
ncbi:hypothetical protein COOONC_08202 [Cooperia oncophora]